MTVESVRFITEEAPCGLLSTQVDGTIVYANQTIRTWLGLTTEDLLPSLRLQDLLTMGCRIFHQTHWLPLLQLQGSLSEVQLQFVHSDGYELPVLVNAIRRDYEDGVRHDIAVFIAADRRKYERELLLARRQAEDLLESFRRAQEELLIVQTRLSLALDATELFLWDLEPETLTPRYAQGVQCLLGLPPTAEVGAQGYRDRMHPDDREQEAQALARTLSSQGERPYHVEYRLLGHDDVERVIVSRGCAFSSADKELAGFSGTLQDVTRWRRAEEVLRSAEQEAQQRAVLAEQLVGIVSHDLRSPLQAIAMGTGLLTSDALSHTQTRAVARIQAAASRATRLIGDLLDFTQARLGGGLRMNVTDVDVDELIHHVVDELRLAWPGRMIAHESEGEGLTHLDPDRVSQLVTNLVANALTYGTADRPVTVTSVTSGGQCTIRVHNEGRPIPEELRATLFEPLRRGAQQVKLGSRSVGLGLYIVQQIVEGHRGTVHLESSEADGTSFLVVFPARAASKDA